MSNSAGQGRVYQLYYSRNDPHCGRVLEIIQQLNRVSLFEFHCIEDMTRATVPPFLQRVPTMIHPTSQQMFVGVSNILPVLAKPVDGRTVVPKRETMGVIGGSQGVEGLEEVGKESFSETFQSFERVDDGYGMGMGAGAGAPGGSYSDFQTSTVPTSAGYPSQTHMMTSAPAHKALVPPIPLMEKGAASSKMSEDDANRRMEELQKEMMSQLGSVQRV